MTTIDSNQLADEIANTGARTSYIRTPDALGQDRPTTRNASIESHMLENLLTSLVPIVNYENERNNLARRAMGSPLIHNVTPFNKHIPSPTFNLITEALRTRVVSEAFGTTPRHLPWEPTIGTRVRIVGRLDPDEYGEQTAIDLMAQVGTIERYYEEEPLPYLVDIDGRGAYYFQLDNIEPE